ncbi:hypothetical protein [Buchananella hordeovulneris]|uniref:hypothetical protein n=1 Tax=Buchananella hordeovulneris TaxID=52770 RepID=UPI000F5E20FA|nr:hypothetical protein [Buchananella hordeovulneris]RRD42700.1 hypothetical protein EII13_08860 [Buchananella hordeovulneris]
MTDLLIVAGDYEQVEASLGKAMGSLGKMQAGGLAGQVVGALPSSVGGEAFAGAEKKMKQERDDLATVTEQTQDGVNNAVTTFGQVEEEIAQLIQNGLNMLTGAITGVE